MAVLTPFHVAAIATTSYRFQKWHTSVGRTMGTALFSMINIIMMSSGISTLDSTFSSLAKLAGPDLFSFYTNGK